MTTKVQKRKIQLVAALKYLKNWLKRPRNAVRIFLIIFGFLTILVIRTLIFKNPIVAFIGLITIILGMFLGSDKQGY